MLRSSIVYNEYGLELICFKTDSNSLQMFDTKVCFVCYLRLKKKVHETMKFLSLFTNFIPKLYDFHSSVEHTRKASLIALN